MSRRPVQSKGSPESDVPRHAITMSWNTAPVGHGGVVALPSSGVRNRPSCRPCRDSASGPRSAVRHPGTLPARVDRGHRRPALHGIGHSRTDMAACAHSASHMAAGARHEASQWRPRPPRPTTPTGTVSITAGSHRLSPPEGVGVPSVTAIPGTCRRSRGVGPWIGAGDTRPDRHPGGRHAPQSASGRATPAPIGRHRSSQG